MPEIGYWQIHWKEIVSILLGKELSDCKKFLIEIIIKAAALSSRFQLIAHGEEFSTSEIL